MIKLFPNNCTTVWHSRIFIGIKLYLANKVKSSMFHLQLKNIMRQENIILKREKSSYMNRGRNGIDNGICR